MRSFQRLEVVGRGSETQLQVAENLYKSSVDWAYVITGLQKQGLYLVLNLRILEHVINIFERQSISNQVRVHSPGVRRTAGEACGNKLLQACTLTKHERLHTI